MKSFSIIFVIFVLVLFSTVKCQNNANNSTVVDSVWNFIINGTSCKNGQTLYPKLFPSYNVVMSPDVRMTSVKLIGPNLPSWWLSSGTPLATGKVSPIPREISVICQNGLNNTMNPVRQFLCAMDQGGKVQYCSCFDLSKRVPVFTFWNYATTTQATINVYVNSWEQGNYNIFYRANSRQTIDSTYNDGNGVYEFIPSVMQILASPPLPPSYAFQELPNSIPRTDPTSPILIYMRGNLAPGFLGGTPNVINTVPFRVPSLSVNKMLEERIIPKLLNQLPNLLNFPVQCQVWTASVFSLPQTFAFEQIPDDATYISINGSNILSPGDQPRGVIVPPAFYKIITCNPTASSFVNLPTSYSNVSSSVAISIYFTNDLTPTIQVQYIDEMLQNLNDINPEAINNTAAAQPFLHPIALMLANYTLQRTLEPIFKSQLESLIASDQANPPDPPQCSLIANSCPPKSISNPCSSGFSTRGNYQTLQFVQQWPGTYCRTTCCSLPTDYPLPGNFLLNENFTIEGLWPGGKGNFQCCTSFGSSFNATLEIQNWIGQNETRETFIQYNWPDIGPSGILQYQINLHATCGDWASLTDYMETVISLRYKWNILQLIKIIGVIPNATNSYSLSSIINQLSSLIGATPQVTCDLTYLNEVIICLDPVTRLPIDCVGLPIKRCPSSVTLLPTPSNVFYSSSYLNS